MRYFYNEDTHRLHIDSYCKVSKSYPCRVRFFDTYDEALAYDGRAVSLCKNCAKKENEIRMREEKK